MSMSRIPSILSTVDFTAPRPSWISALARYTRKRRAELAGLEMSEWAALESGWVPNPDDIALIRSIAGTLEVSWVDFSFLALMAACQRPHPEESAGQA